MEEGKIVARAREREGTVVWDQRGIVVVWPNGHSRRFSWETLQHLSSCAECLEHGPRQQVVSQYGAQ
jgi:DUF971 family protein